MNSKGSRLVCQSAVLPVLQKLVIKTATMLLGFVSLVPQPFLEYYSLFFVVVEVLSGKNHETDLEKLHFQKSWVLQLKHLNNKAARYFLALLYILNTIITSEKKLSPRKLPSYERDIKDSNRQN